MKLALAALALAGAVSALPRIFDGSRPHHHGHHGHGHGHHDSENEQPLLGFPRELNITWPSANYSIIDLIHEHNRTTITLPPIPKDASVAKAGAKAGAKAQGADVCINSFGGFVVVVSETAMADGDAACGQFGFEWAVVGSDDAFNVYRTMAGCSTIVASIKSYNGYNSTTCGVTVLGALFALDLPYDVCQLPLTAFVCQRVPQENVTITSYTTVATERVTATVTDVVRPTCPSCKLHTCPFGKSHLHVIHERLPFKEAACACRELGMELADLDILNFLDATDVLFQCAGAFKKAWIRSWNGDSYHHECLALSTGVMAPGGAINVPAKCRERLPVLCKAHPCYSQCKPCWNQHGGNDKPCRDCPQDCQQNWWPVPCADSDDQRCWPYVEPERCPCDAWGNEQWSQYCGNHQCHAAHGQHEQRKPANHYGYDNNEHYFYQQHHRNHSHSHGRHYPYDGHCPCSPGSYEHSRDYDRSSSPSSNYHPRDHHRSDKDAQAEVAVSGDKAPAKEALPAKKILVELDKDKDFTLKTAADYPEDKSVNLPNPTAGYHLLRRSLNWPEAWHACHCHGWRLVDVTYENVETIKALVWQNRLEEPIWMRSWFFFDGGECRAMYPEVLLAPTKSAESKANIKGLSKIEIGEKKPPGLKAPIGDIWLIGLFAEFEPLCLAFEFRVLCQEYPKVPARTTGPVEVSTSYSYTTTTEPVTYTTEVRTVTRTVTIRK